MGDPATLGQLAIDAVFSQFGKAATYTPPPSNRTFGNGAIDCTVIIDRADREIDHGVSRLVRQGVVIEVRASEIATVERGGAFVVGDDAFQVMDAPERQDPERLIWSCTVG
jgi:hypothetical protein